MTTLEELEYLDKLKRKLLDNCVDVPKVSITAGGSQTIVLEIFSDVWHRIFKTVEYNKTKEQ